MNLPIAIFVSMFGLWITISIFVRYFAYTNWSLWIKAGCFLLCAVIALLPVFVPRDWSKVYGPRFALVETVFYFIYIFAIILFALTIMRDVVWLVLSWCHLTKNPFEVVGFVRANTITILIALICSAWSLYEGTRVPAVKETILTSPKITQEKSVVVLSDLHISRTVNSKKIQGIVEKTNALNPDVILLAGDIVDDEVDIIRDKLALLSDLKAKQGVYFVSGNHEFYVGYSASMHALEELGLTSLENVQISLEPQFYLIGTADIPTTARFGSGTNVKEFFKDIPESVYALFMTHSPVKLDLPFDLQVSGHTHGGQIFPFHIFSWWGNNHFLAGYYPKDRLYVSRGSGQWGPQMRFLAPSEISLIRLKPAQ